MTNYVKVCKLWWLNYFYDELKMIYLFLETHKTMICNRNKQVSMPSHEDGLSYCSVLRICNNGRQQKCCWILLLHWIQLCLPLALSKSIFFELLVLIHLVLYLIHLVSAEVSLNCISRIRFRCSFFWPWENQYMVHGFNSTSNAQFPAIIWSVLAEGSINCVAHSI